MNQNLKGIVLITLSAVCFGSYGIWSRLMGANFSDFSQAWIRGVLLVGLLLPVGLFAHKLRPICKSDLKWFIAISVAGGFNQAPYFLAFQKLPIGTATLLFYAALTIGGYLMGKLFLNEKIDLNKYVSLILALIGMYCIFTFSLSWSQIWPALMAILAGLMGGIEVALTKKISNNYSGIQILLFIFSTMLIGNGLISWLNGDSVPQISFTIPWLALLGYTLAIFLAMFFVVWGFKYIQASVGSLIGLTEILFALIFGVIFFGEIIDWSTVLGASLILIAAGLPYIKNKSTN
ncbi:hypothetical protein COX08_01990 [Candidatus Beckwithbacteria bacterium CG23_combo_of_CG06-09_8_20_14_all_34_8]|uniref:EamA domain-containing protein n=1 Tax=Candidatus Beckwithbacteria bacterium CG23_combo_of_CG06-09_8_20_14_all_34_8 TaxID=1974497 RepID=A0A2H0B6I2_9BACT|nr:MAG: hypothetical protein COX08_01990 [Candidatus Beckwithbacteria bacterium CG23_combo_of_CG06-09_8_20_14_all_34_8]